MITVPLDRLPIDPEDRQEVLLRYFPDRIPIAVRGGAGWEIELYAPPTLGHYVDPSVAMGLSWWNPDLPIEQIPLDHRQEQGAQVSLNDAWTLFSWSHWLSRCSPKPTEVVLLHADSHTDLMSPLLLVSNGQLIDSMTGAQVSIADPMSIRSAIESSAIGMGSFLVPLLFTIDAVHIRHLRATDSFPGRIAPPELSNPLCVQRSTIPDTLIRPGGSRPSVECLPTGSVPSASTYTLCSNPTEWIQDLPPGPVLVHVDMDYFNNRFDGDSDWQSHESRHDPSEAAVVTMVDDVSLALNDPSVRRRIEDITIALCPGFFPGALWEKATERLLDGLPRAARSQG